MCRHDRLAADELKTDLLNLTLPWLLAFRDSPGAVRSGAPRRRRGPNRSTAGRSWDTDPCVALWSSSRPPSIEIGQGQGDVGELTVHLGDEVGTTGGGADQRKPAMLLRQDDELLHGGDRFELTGQSL